MWAELEREGEEEEGREGGRERCVDISPYPKALEQYPYPWFVFVNLIFPNKILAYIIKSILHICESISVNSNIDFGWLESRGRIQA